MSILYVLFFLVVLLVIFGIVYKVKGLKIALVATGVALAGFVVLYFGLISLIVYSMD